MNKKSLLFKILTSIFLQLAILCCVLVSASASSIKPTGGPSGFTKSDYLTPGYAADINITGHITDEKNLPMPGATVQIKGTKIGTTADVNGKFTLTVPENATLVISSIGYV
ncbi:MAG TPA: carboxypeptidase-like regulatory domain-containing protein, partial [Pedobacter sp.]